MLGAAIRGRLEESGIDALTAALAAGADAGKGRRLTSTSIYRIVRELGEQVQVRARPSVACEPLAASASGRAACRSRTCGCNRWSGRRRRACRCAPAGQLPNIAPPSSAANRQDLGGKMARLVAATL